MACPLTDSGTCAMVRPMTSAEPLLTSADVSQILGRSVRTVLRMVDAGTLAYAQRLPGPNGAYLFRREDVEALFERRSA